MRGSEIFREYIWLVDLIWRAGRITFEEIQARWLRSSLSDGRPLARSTFNRHRAAIEDIFDLNIDCDRRDNAYYIANADTLGDNSVIRWMAQNLSVQTLLSDSRAIYDRILLEPVPTGGEMLGEVIEAMKQGRKIRVVYKKWEEPEREYLLEPYCVKLFKQRWYLLGRRGEGPLQIFSFERIASVTIDEESFTLDPGFDAETYFAEYFGATTGMGAELATIRLRAYGRDRYYLRDLPMHPSQRFVEEGDIYWEFELRLRPTPDFMAAILSRGGWVQVVSPEWLADEIRERAQFMLDAIDEMKE